MCLGIPGKIVRIEGEDPVYRSGSVEIGGITKDVSLAYVPDAGVGDYVIVHAGFAISEIDEEEAKQVFEMIQQLDAEELEEVK